jgi:mRNA-degrading endonuclease toxin of MazEF toxin-antitoxin module
MGSRTARHGAQKAPLEKVVIRGSIHWVNLEDTHPPEFGKTRPALVLSNTEQNAVLGTVVVVPISTRPPHIWPLRLELPPLPGLKKSFAVVPGIRQVSKSRLVEEAGVLSEEVLESVLEAVSAYLGD